MDKLILCKEVGDYFGKYFEENEMLCIDNYENIFKYNTADELLTDWIDTLVENHHDAFYINDKGQEYNSWEKEIQFIYEKIIGKYPTGIRAYNGKTKKMFQVEVYEPDGSKHGKMIYLGRYHSVVDAIFSIKDYKNKSKKKEEENK